MSAKETLKQSPQESTNHLPEFVLLALARNESADPAYRKAAVEHLIEKGYIREANHPELSLLAAQVRKEREAKDEVQAIVESAVEAPLESMKASVTTSTMYSDEVVEAPKSRFWGK